MNPKKQKEKDRRCARKLAEEAWEAVNDGNLDLAEKIIRRSVVAQQDNPVLWVEQGAILALRHNEAESADAYRAAISLAPTFAEAYARLAALRFRQGFTREAATLQREAVKHEPENAGYAEQLVAYAAAAGGMTAKATASRQAQAPSTPPQSADDAYGAWPERLSEYDWDDVGAGLTRRDARLLERLMEASDCEALRVLFDRDDLFARTRIMDQPDYGKGTYRYFKAPIPPVVDRLRRSIYRHVAAIANDWQRLLNEPERYPKTWDEYRDVCHGAGQSFSTPILLKYEAGGFNALHRDLRGNVYFPIQLAVILSPRSENGEGTIGFRGGEFLFCDVPERKKSCRREIAAGLGDAVLFCTRDRLVRVGDVYGLQPVKHGVARITAGTRVCARRTVSRVSLGVMTVLSTSSGLAGLAADAPSSSPRCASPIASYCGSCSCCRSWDFSIAGRCAAIVSPSPASAVPPPSRGSSPNPSCAGAGSAWRTRSHGSCWCWDWRARVGGRATRRAWPSAATS